MKCTIAPFFGSHIGYGFGKVPAVAVKILSVVLALAVGLLLWFSQDDGSILSCAVAVTFSIFDANLNDVRIVGRHISFGDGEAALAGLHLDAVICDAETGRRLEPEPVAMTRGARMAVPGSDQEVLLVLDRKKLVCTVRFADCKYGDCGKVSHETPTQKLGHPPG